MSILKNGYYKVQRSEDGKLYVITMGGNNEPINSSETLGTWQSIVKNVKAAVRAANGKFGIIVDATLENIQGKKLYYRINTDGDLRLVNVQGDEVQADLDKLVDATPQGLEPAPAILHERHPRTEEFKNVPAPEENGGNIGDTNL